MWSKLKLSVAYCYYHIVKVPCTYLHTVHIHQYYCWIKVIKNPKVITLSDWNVTNLKVCDEDAEVPWSVSDDNVTGSHPTHFDENIFFYLFTKTKLEWSLFRRQTSVVQNFLIFFSLIWVLLITLFTFWKEIFVFVLAFHNKFQYYYCGLVCFDYKIKSGGKLILMQLSFLTDRERASNFFLKSVTKCDKNK